MTEPAKTDFRYTTKTNFTQAELQSCLETIPALFWRIDIVHNKIEYLNSYRIQGLGEETMLLLRNIRFREEVILEEDMPLFDEFMKSVARRKASVNIFRIKLFDGTIRWLKITGAPNSDNAAFFNGYLVDITDLPDMIRHLDEKEARIGEKIALFDNPILLINFHDKKVHSANTAFFETFQLSDKAVGTVTLNEILGNNPQGSLESVFEEIIFHQQWNGELTFRDGNLDEFSAESAVRVISKEGKNLLWISVHPHAARKQQQDNSPRETPGEATDSDKLAALLRRSVEAGDIMELLDTIRKNQPIENLADSILYSDVHIDQGKVITYGVGPSFETLEPGKEYPYEGTIAENIIRFNLDSIIVENTLKSIKPIDWALFIPQNVLSYYAKPFYEGANLKSVFIFCSRKQSVFSEENTRCYEPLFPSIEESLTLARKRHSA